MQISKLYLLILFTFFGKICFSQTFKDTTFLTFENAEKIFLQKNLNLIAAKYNIDINEALIEQAKYWDNPILSTDQNLFDGTKGEGKFLAHNANRGQIYFQVTELIRTANKRNKLSQLANDNTLIAKQQFEDVMRNMKYALRSDLLEIAHQLKIKKIYDGEIAQIKVLSKAIDEVYKSGNVALKETIRIKAIIFNLENEIVNIESNLFPLESDLKLLLQSKDSNFITLTPNYKLPEIINATIPNYDSIIQFAIQNRPDLKIANAQLIFQNDNYIYQKALAKPDITIGTEYDQRSSYNPNYIGLTVSVPLTVFNKNQGNIKSADFSIKQQQVQISETKFKIQNEIENAINKFKYYQKVNNKDQLDFSKKYDDLFQNMLNSYKERQISLIEFTDFIDSYKDTKLKMIEQHNALLKAAVDLNFITNNNLISLN